MQPSNTVMQRKISFLAFLVSFFVSSGPLVAVEFSDADLADANRISRLVGRPLDKPTVAYLEQKRESLNEAVSILAHTALFVSTQKKNRNAFMAALAIDDHADRQSGKKEVVSFGHLQRLLKSVDTRAKGDKDDERIILLIEFIDLKQRNLWFEGPGGHISLSRFIRGMYLGSAFEGSKLDTEKIANEIDEKTQKKKA